jgi:hypothetical protein
MKPNNITTTTNKPVCKEEKKKLDIKVTKGDFIGRYHPSHLFKLSQVENCLDNGKRA